MAEYIETIIVGGGQAGLATSYCLNQLGKENIVLEQAAHVAHAWRNQRWDSFTLVVPNWSLILPGTEYRGPDPDGFMPKTEIVSYFEQYAREHRLPVRYEMAVTCIEPTETGTYTVSAGAATFNAKNVVVATGMFQKPKIPANVLVPSWVHQLHSSEYRNPETLPPGGVLVVGSGQSACQIAEELYQSGRKVYVSVGTTGRVPRRYRGKDITRWLDAIGFFDRTVDKLPSPRARFSGGPQVSGKDGGHNLNLHQFARDGVILLGRIQGSRDGKFVLAPNLKEVLAHTDKFEVDLLKTIDELVEKNGLDAPKESLPHLRDGYDAPTISELDMKAEGVNTILWASGYRFDYSIVKAPVFDQDGFPIQRGGVTNRPGLYFVGLPWMDTFRTGLLLGVSNNARNVASHIANRAAHA